MVLFGGCKVIRDETTWTCLKIALCSRLLTLILQALFNAIIPDHEPEVFRTPVSENKMYLDDYLVFLFNGTTRWDSQYFLHIAQYGYTYENTLAFFPLYPLLVRFIGICLHFLLEPWINFYTVLVVSGAMLNLVLFVSSAAVLYRLTYTILGDKIIAQKAVYLFCVNPASVFFSSCYSESLFTFLVFSGMLFTENGRPFWGAIMFGLGSATRSNGILCAGFLFHSQIRRLIRNLSYWKGVILLQIRTSLLWVVNTSLHLVLCTSPFVMFQLYAFVLFCIPLAIPFETSQEVTSYGKSKGLLMPSEEPSPWCNSDLPLSYSYVQKNYWGVGFLSYYEWKQIPNFLLALPLVLIVGIFSVAYFWENAVMCKSLGLLTKFEKSPNVIENSRCFVYVVHLCALTIFCVLWIHVQVTTRMVASSSPLLYWITAWILTPVVPEDHTLCKDEHNRTQNQEATFESSLLWHPQRMLGTLKGKLPHLILAYFYSYWFLGIVLHSNFLPWT